MIELATYSEGYSRGYNTCVCVCRCVGVYPACVSYVCVWGGGGGVMHVFMHTLWLMILSIYINGIIYIVHVNTQWGYLLVCIHVLFIDDVLFVECMTSSSWTN